MPADKPLRVRDPVHGFIPYTREEGALIDTPPLQRLRTITQLAFTSLVYPGATHSRFEHSLGVMHIAGRIADRVKLSVPERRLVRLAALLHDIGHLPFSHAGEAALAGLMPEMAKLSEEAHERFTVALIEHDADIHRVLHKEKDRRAVLDILDKGSRPRLRRPLDPILSQIVSGPLDADKLDYLLRDSLMAGVKYGIFDLERMIDAFVPHGQRGDRNLAVWREDVACIDQYVLARYYMTLQVYRHQVRRISDAMLKEAVLCAVHLRGRRATRLGRFFTSMPFDPHWHSDFLLTTDASLLADLICLPANTRSGTLARRLHDRRLLKQVFECKIKDIPESGAAWREDLVKDVAKQEALAKRFAKALRVTPGLILVDIRQLGNPLYRDPGLSLEEDIRVVDRSGRDERLGDISESLSQKVKVEAEADLYVYVPADGHSAGARKRMGRTIRKVLATTAREG